MKHKKQKYLIDIDCLDILTKQLDTYTYKLVNDTNTTRKQFKNKKANNNKLLIKDHLITLLLIIISIICTALAAFTAFYYGILY